VGGCWSSNVNEDVNLFKVEVSDMHFRPFMQGNLLGRGLTLRLPTVGHHGSVRWYQASRLGFNFLVRQTGSVQEAMNMDQKGFLRGAPGWAKCSLTLWGLGQWVFLGPCFRGKKRVNLEFTWLPTSSFWCPPKGSNLVLFLGGLGWESVGS
jgi:hypothetical protein